MFFIYEQYEEEIEGIAEILLNFTRAVMGFLLKNLPVPVASLLFTDEILHEDDDPAHLKDYI